ncbi:MAG: hypothetical protein R3C05_20605 [Pirellulaceae bacterium]
MDRETFVDAIIDIKANFLVNESNQKSPLPENHFPVPANSIN